MIEHLINIQYCYNYLIDQIPVSLLVYSHIPTSFVSLLIGIFILVKEKNRQSFVLFLITALFTLWCVLDLASWFMFVGSDKVMASWSALDLISLIIFFLSYYFLHLFITKKDLSVIQWLLSVGIMLPTFFVTWLGKNIAYYDSNTCTAIESSNITSLPYIASAVFIILSISLTIKQYIKSKDDKKEKKETLFIGIGVNIFLIFFYSAILLISLLSDSGLSDYVYNYQIYGLFGMPLFVLFLLYSIVRFKAFDIKLIGSQALVWGLVILISSQFFFIQSNVNRVLTAITLVLTTIMGLMIIRSVKQEIAQKEELELANQNQQLLIRFITHQVKGFFTKSKMVFASLLEGDFGEVPDGVKNIAKDGLESDNKAVDMVQEVLNASSLRSGQVSYDFKEVDLVSLIKEVSEKFKERMIQKGVIYEIDLPNNPVIINADKTQITQVFKNLIDNACYYTLTGSVKISLSLNKEKVLFVVQDTGVGLTEKDKSILFKEGGRGEESLKFNINSTGYGLFIVKKIVEGHGGKIWAESAGRGHGSKFYVEVPIKK